MALVRRPRGQLIHPPVSENLKLMAQWDYAKNDALGFDPRRLTQGSGIKVWWLCSVKSTEQCDDSCRHSWPCVIAVRARAVNPTGCPTCCTSGSYKKCCVHASLAGLYPHLAKQWVCVIGNQFHQSGEEIKPYNTLPSSSVIVLWRCLEPKLTPHCDAKCAHIWETSVEGRTQQETGCPFAGCAEYPRRCCLHYSLQWLYPDVADQWDFVRNKDSNIPTPDKISPSSSEKKFWICSRDPNHHWEAIVASRTALRTGCPKCYNKTEAKLEAWLLSRFPDLVCQERISIDHSYHYYDFFIPSLNLYVELDGDQHFRKIKHWKSDPDVIRSRDIIKMDTAWSRGYSMIRIYQENVYRDYCNWDSELSKWLNYFRVNTQLSIVFIIGKLEFYQKHITDFTNLTANKWPLEVENNVIRNIAKY